MNVNIFGGEIINYMEATGMYSIKKTTENSAVFYYTAK